MHEYSITCSIIEILYDLIKKYNIKKLKKVSFEISPLAQIEPQSIEFYYNFMTKENGTLKGAGLEFKKGKIKFECKTCEKYFTSENLISNCIYCSGEKIKATDIDDIKIISIEA